MAIKHRGIRARIVRTEHHSPNAGISADNDTALIMTPTGPHRTAKHPVVKPVHRVLEGLDYWHFEPVDAPGPHEVGYMASGAYLLIEPEGAKLLGLPTRGLYALHDRTEPRLTGDAAGE